MQGSLSPADGWERRSITEVGVGLRHVHLPYVIQHKPDIPWFEILADNHMEAGGMALRMLSEVRVDYPMTLHSVGMSIGSTDPLDYSYLDSIKKLAERFEPAWISDHLCFTHVGERHFHELLPLPYTEESLYHVSERIQKIQDYLGRRILVENVSSYASYQQSTIPEWEFICALVQQADCELLLDINNAYVNSVNQQFDANVYLDAIPVERVREIHLAGYEDRGNYLLDSHSSLVSEEVWGLYARFMSHNQVIPTLIEWDNAIPDFEVLEEEAGRARQICRGLTPAIEQQVALM